MDISWRPNELGHPRLGMVIPLFGHGAVERNQVRRRIREISRRRILPLVKGLDLVVRSRRKAYEATFDDLTTDLKQWLHSLSD